MQEQIKYNKDIKCEEITSSKGKSQKLHKRGGFFLTPAMMGKNSISENVGSGSWGERGATIPDEE